MALLAIPPVYVLYGIVAVGAVKVVYELFFSPLSHIPGPFLAKFTDLYRSGLTHMGHVDSHKRRWHQKWGPAVRVGPNAISISDPDMIKVIYTTKNPWRKSDMYRPNDVVVNGQRIQNIFNTQDAHFHSKYTRPIGGFWTMSKILDLEPVMDETLLELLANVDRRFASTGDVCMLEDWISYYAWDAAANVSFGRHYGFMNEGRDVGSIIAESTAGLKYFAPVSQLPLLDELLDKNPIWRIGPRPLVNGFLYTVRMLDEYRQEGEARRKSVDLFIDRYNGLKAQYDFVDDAQVTHWLMLNVLAGGDSTSGAMRSVAYHVLKTPRVHVRLVAELDAAAEAGNLVLPARWADVARLPYFDAVMRESFRIAPALGLMLEREVPEGGIELPDGRFVPARTKMGINPCVVTRDRGLFGDDADTFRPERWLRVKGEEGEAEYTRRVRRMHEATDFMYGHGTRVCMGKHLAKVEMYKLFATLFAAYDIKLTNPDHEWKYHNSWFMYHSDIPCTITRRNKA
ncbi:unnamed protein product [Clonostachys chloroleuca]|uniref:Cytochrome P450 n=1 Tax=Clonostachys chloroleuca TaxID=1926264 RepID=A0AA35LXA6_9HYPO|nr:unnamed protein product [Clonostachys chloroleuca]